MNAFKKFDPQAFLERERRAPESIETLATLATLAGQPLENEIRKTPIPPWDNGALPAKSIELQGDDHAVERGLDQLGKNQSPTPTPAKVAKVAKVHAPANNFSNFSSPAAEQIGDGAEAALRGMAADVCDATPYASALTALRAKCPDYVPEDRWQQAIGDATAFISEWGAQAQALGWTEHALLGLHSPPEQPAANYSRLSRLDDMGLIWLLRGRPIVELAPMEAIIRCHRGAHLTICCGSSAKQEPTDFANCTACRSQAHRRPESQPRLPSWP
jgi:hypothetical protein